MKTFINWGFIIFILVFTNSCEKDKTDTLPAETTLGKNTFGCLVNGNIWVNKGVNNFLSPANVAFISYPQRYEFRVSASNTTQNKQQSIVIVIGSSLKIGTYYLNNAKNYALFNKEESNCYYRTDSTVNAGTLEITYIDWFSKIVAGKFKFDVSKFQRYPDEDQSHECDPNISVTEGRFDIKYKSPPF